MNLAEHIEAKNLSRADICAGAGISRSMLSMIETGKRRIGLDRAQAFASALGLPVHMVRPDLAQMFAPAGDHPQGEEIPANSNRESFHVHTPETDTDAA